jgi:hypothetical protein
VNPEAFLQWLVAPLNGTTQGHDLAQAIAWHGRLMMLAWGVFVPLGILAARFWKQWPGQDWPSQLDHKGWWNIHRTLQWGAIGLMTLAVVLLYGTSISASDPVAVLHRYLGFCMLGLGWLQVLGSFFRGSKGGPTEPLMRGDHYDMSLRRQRFEWIHKTTGWLCLVIASFTLVLGLWLAGAPRWMWGALLLWWLLLIGFGTRWQRQGRCLDTYQAIWGTSEHLPGLRRAPIGWGVSRRLPPSFSPASNQKSHQKETHHETPQLH